jgi:4-hydroxy-tetrahydrodipicolinate synthase
MPPAPSRPTGIHVPLITPFTHDDRIAGDALAALAHTALDEGATGLVALGTTAEAAALDADERRTVLDICAQVCRERGAPLTVGTGTNDTRATAAALAELPARCPEAAAALVPVPYYTRPTAAGVLAHYTALAAVTPVPLLVYHIPYRTGQPLDAATLRAIGRLDGIAGVKYATGAITADTVDLLTDPPTPDFAILAGDDALLAPLLALGATGGILPPRTSPPATTARS